MADRHRRIRRLALSGVLGVAVAGSPMTAVYAEPDPVFPSAEQVQGAQAAASDQAADVAAIDAHLASARASLQLAYEAAGAAAEAHNAAVLELQERTAQAAEAARQAEAATAAADAAELALSRYAAEVFQGGGGVSQLDIFFGGDPQDALDRASGLEVVGDERARASGEAASARLVADQARQQAAEAQSRQGEAAAASEQTARAAQNAAASAASQAAAVEAEQEQAVARLAVLRNTSAQLERDRQAGLAAEAEARRQEAARQAAAEAAADLQRQADSERAAEADRAAAAEQAAKSAREAQIAREQARTTPAPAPVRAPAPVPPVSSPPAPPPATTPPAPSAGVGAVVAFARAQLGEPYVWGGSGPSVWDCSGLTQAAWAAAGVRLSHYTGAQWAETRRVPLSALRTGDLVFYGPSGPSSTHVGLYIGGGMMIHAPRTGDVVKVASIYSVSQLLPYGGRPG